MNSEHLTFSKETILGMVVLIWAFTIIAISSSAYNCGKSETILMHYKKSQLNKDNQ